MKKILTLSLLFWLVMLFGCSGNTTAVTYTNPDIETCDPGTTEGVFICQKTWTSYFDAPINLKIYYTPETDVDLDSVFADTEATLANYHQLFDKYHTYPGMTNVYDINHRTGDTATIGEELFAAISFALDKENDIEADGVDLFNIAMGPVLDIWHDARENPECENAGLYDICPVPRDLIAVGGFPTDPDNIVLDPEQGTISFLVPGMELDLGGYGKGYVSEIITDRLDLTNLNYILNAGESNLKAGGTNPQREDGLYYIGLKTPDLEQIVSSFYCYVKIPSGISVVTSGNYQRYFIGADDMEVYHHIIDPRTNYPGGEAMSVTLFYEDGALADIYSTAIYLLTIQEGLDFVNAKEGLEAIWYAEDGTIFTSDNFESLYLYQYPSQ